MLFIDRLTAVFVVAFPSAIEAHVSDLHDEESQPDPFWSSEEVSKRILTDLVFDLENKYQESVYDLSKAHDLEPTNAPVGGPEFYWQQYALGIARYRSLFELTDDALSDAVRAYLVSLYGDVAKQFPRDGLLLFGRQFRTGALSDAAFRISLIGDALRMLHTSLSRADALLLLVGARQLSFRATRFMRRATRLYLHGFDVETVIMSAAAVEAAYEYRFSHETMIASGFKSQRSYKAGQYEAAARQTGVFTADEGASAERLRSARNDSVHLVPEPALAALDALGICAMLLDRLFPASATE